MKRKIKILYVTAEIAPYANAGGLGEVGRSFPKALYDSGRFEIHRVMPLYKRIKKKLKYITDFPVSMDQTYETCIVKKDPEEKELPTYFIQNDRYFYRENIYSYEDDGFRFFFFCKAVVEMLKSISFRPDIVHMNDWHTGFLPLLLKKEFPAIKTVFTIHNISYHGFVPASYVRNLITEQEQFKLGYPEWLNFMKAGLKYADLVTTVSPGYAGEILQPELSSGMVQILADRSNVPEGILNGIDVEQYNPSLEEGSVIPFDHNSFERKKENRKLLRSQYGLPDEEKPLIAMVTRLDYYKGIDLIIKALKYLDLSSFQLIILGSGNAYYEDILSGIKKAYGNIVIEFNYTPELAKLIYAAADIYLMPSQYEPCGLGQLYAMRYGAVPVVNPVGGLKDTVRDEQVPEISTGFYMESWDEVALSKAITRAIETYHTPDWKYYVKNAMTYDSSWERSIVEYQKYYEELLSE